MSESTSQLKIGAALDGSFEQTTTTVKRKIGELGAAATSTGKSLAGMGDGTAQSAQKVEQATKSMIQSIQRTTAATEVGDKSTRAYQESLARMRGIDVAALKPYLDQLDAAKSKAAQATAANNSLGDSFAGMGSRSLIAANAIGMIGAALTAAFSAASINGVIDVADNFSKLAQKSGVAVDALRELNYAASLSDVSTEALGTGLRKLSQNMAAAAGGSKEQAAAFAAIGISVKGVDGDLKGADKVLSEVSAKFATFKDGPEKAALAIELFGKAGADMIPLLNSGATGLAEMAKEANDLGVVFSSELAKSAEAFNDNLTRIQASAEGTKIAIANELLPTLNLLAQAFLDAKKESSGFGGFIGGALRTIIEAATILYANVEFVLKGIGREFGAVGAQVVALGKLDIKGFNAISQAVKEDGVRARAELDKFQYDLLNAGILNSKAGAGRGAGVDPRLLGDTQTTAPIVAAEKAAKAAQISDYEKLTKAIAEKTAVANLDLLTREKLTEGQKLAAKFEADLLMATLKMTDAEIKSTRARLSGLVSIEQAIITKEKATKRMVDEYTAELEVQKELTAAQVATDNARATGIQGVTAYADSIKEQNEYSQLELSLMGSSATAREIALGQYKVELDLKKQIEAIDSNTGFDEAERITQRARARAAAAQSMAVVETKVYTDEWKKTADSIQSSLTDALLRGFESGKDFAKNLRDTLVNMFKTLVLRPIISAVVNPVAGALTGALGLSGAAQAAGTGSSLLSGASTLASLSGALGAGLKAGFSGLIGEAGLMGTLSAGTTALGAGNIIGGIGTLAAPLALATAAILGLSAIIKATSGETRNGAAYGVGLDGMATKLQGPSGGEIASKEARAMFNITKSSIEGMLTAFGSKAVLTGFTAGLESSDNGKGFAYAGGQINGKGFGESGGRDGGQFKMGNKTQEQALKDYQLNLTQSILEGLQVTADIPATVAKLIANGLNGSEVKDLTLEATSAILLTVETLSKQVNTFNSAMMSLPFEALKNLSFDVAAGLIAAAGGFEKLDANLGGFYQNFFSASEQTAQLTSTTSKAFSDLGLVMPKLDEGARAAYRSMVELAAGKDLSVAANAKAYASLLALQGPMNELAPTLDSVAASARDARTSYLELIKTTADAAYATLDRAVGAQRVGADLTLSLAKEQISAIKSVFDTLKSSVQSLYGQTDSTTQGQAAQGQAFILQALATAKSTGYIPDATALTDAIAASRAGIDSTIYASQSDADFARLTLAGSLSELQDIGGVQLTEAQKAIKVAEAQVTSLDAILKTAKAQLDAANGINTSVLSVAQALDNFAASLTVLLTPATATPSVAAGAGSASASAGFSGIQGGGGATGAKPSDSVLADYLGQVGYDAGRAETQGAVAQNLYERFAGLGVTQGDIARVSGQSLGDVEYWFDALGVNRFASGGAFTNGIVSRPTNFAMGQMGEAGPEAILPLVNIGGSLGVRSAGGGGSDNSRMEALIEGLTKEVQRLQSIVNDGNQNTRRTADTLDNVTEGGSNMRTVTL